MNRAIIKKLRDSPLIEFERWEETSTDSRNQGYVLLKGDSPKYYVKIGKNSHFESEVLRVLATFKSISVPTPVLSEEEFIVMDYIKFSRSSTMNYVKDIAAFHLETQNKNIEVNVNSEQIDKWINKSITLLKDPLLRAKTQISPSKNTRRLILSLEELSELSERTFLHTDLSILNLGKNEREKTIVFDWEKASCGPFYWEFSQMFLDNPRSLQRRIIERYCSVAGIEDEKDKEKTLILARKAYCCRIINWAYGLTKYRSHLDNSLFIKKLGEDLAYSIDRIL